MIKIFLGNLGSGKTVCAVREMYLNQNNCFSNINTNMENCQVIRPEYIIKKEIVDYKKNKKSGDKEPIYKSELNMDFWQNTKKPCDVYLDEAHTIINARRSMSKTNIILGEWLSMLRRVLNDSEGKTGDLILISQRLMKLDENARDMCNLIAFHICHYLKECNDCHFIVQENSDMPRVMKVCLSCGSQNIKKHTFNIEVLEFESDEHFNLWKFNHEDTYFDNYLIPSIEKYFSMYNTLQWDNLFKGYY